MSEGVKHTAESGTRRAQQARATRRRIIDQAAKLFIEQGYAATTLDQISTAAGVAVQTVYFHFRNKATVLKEVVDVAAVGDDEPVPVMDRPWVRRVRKEPDGRRALAIYLRNARAIFERIAPIMKTVRDAAAATRRWPRSGRPTASRPTPRSARSSSGWPTSTRYGQN